MNKQKPVVHLRVYKGNGRNDELSYNASGEVQNENILMKMTHDTLEWSNALKNLKVLGYVKPTVEAVFEGGENNKDLVSVIQKEVDSSYKGPEKQLTPEQQKIAELEAKLEALANGSNKPKKTDPLTNRGLDAIRAEYEEVVGKKPFHGWDEATLKVKIEEAKNS